MSDSESERAPKRKKKVPKQKVKKQTVPSDPSEKVLNTIEKVELKKKKMSEKMASTTGKRSIMDARLPTIIKKAYELSELISNHFAITFITKHDPTDTPTFIPKTDPTDPENEAWTYFSAPKELFLLSAKHAKKKVNVIDDQLYTFISGITIKPATEEIPYFSDTEERVVVDYN